MNSHVGLIIIFITDKLKNASNAIACLSSDQHYEVINFISSQMKIKVIRMKCMKLDLINACL